MAAISSGGGGVELISKMVYLISVVKKAQMVLVLHYSYIIRCHIWLMSQNGSSMEFKTYSDDLMLKCCIYGRHLVKDEIS